MSELYERHDESRPRFRPIEYTNDKTLYRMAKRPLGGVDYDIFPVPDPQATAIVEAVRNTGEWRRWAFMARRAQLDALAEFCEAIADAIEAGG